MKLHILTKIRITLIIALAILISWLINSSYLYNNSGMPINIVFSDSYSSIFTFILASALATAVAFFLGGRNTRYIAPLAAPFALSLPAVFSDNANHLLISYQGQIARSHLFKLMFIDTLLWFLPILAGLGVVVFLGKIHKRQKPAIINEVEKPKLDKSLKKNILAVLVSSLIVIVILPFFCQGDTTYLTSAGSTIMLSTAVSIGQQAFAVTLAFFVAVMASHQIFSTSGRAYIPVPIIVAFYIYMFGNTSIWDSLKNIGVSPVLVPPDKVCQTILPVSFAVFGSLGIAWGYWNSYKLHFARINNLIKVK